MSQDEAQYTPAPRAPDFLRAGIKHMEARAKTHDAPQGERSIPAVVAAFNALTKHTLSDEQGWLFMELLKAARAEQGEYNQDDYEDGASYCALKGEAAHQARAER